MFGEQRTRTLLGPADPARNTATAQPRLSARDVIDLAEATAEPVDHRRRHARPIRRLVLTAGTLAVVAAGTTAIVHTFNATSPDTAPTASPPGPELGTVLLPVSYQYDSDAPAAGPQLRALADRLVNAEYDNSTGRYTYHHTKVWGEPLVTSPDGRYLISHITEWKVWQAPDGSGRQITIPHEPQYPDQESREYWQQEVLKAQAAEPVTSVSPGPQLSYMPLPPRPDSAPLPSNRAELAELLKVSIGGGPVSKQVSTVYGRYVVPRQTRAEILRILADVPGFLWRGQVTDRGGRNGVAITFDDREHDQRWLLIFDPNTGELLADELLTLSPVRVSSYQVILGTAWTDRF